MKRRTFLARAGAQAFAASFSQWVSAGAATRLNVLFLMSDDHAAYVTGLDGNRLARTPNIDALGRSGAWCPRAYCNSPMCTPSRQSYITGLLPHATGVTRLRTALNDAETTTVAERLATFGYKTGAIGKMHFNSPARHGFAYRFDLPDVRKWWRSHPRRPIPPGVRTYGPWRPFRDPAAVWLNAECLPAPYYEADSPSTVFARKAKEFMHRNRNHPFFLCVSFYEPHSPFRFPIEYAGTFSPDMFTPPEVAPSDHPQIPAIFRSLTEREKRGIICAAYTSTYFMDKKVGEVLGALQELGLAETTLVIYVGDNGYSLGHHGRFEKHTFYEESVRVPLIFRLPGVIPPGTQMGGLLELVDIVPTMLDFLDLPIPGDLHGLSAASAIRKGAAHFRPRVFSEYYHNEECMVRTEKWKYIFRVGERTRDDGYKTASPPEGMKEILINLSEDPQEINDVSNRRSLWPIVERMRRFAVERFRATWPQKPVPLLQDDREALRWFLTHNPDRPQ